MLSPVTQISLSSLDAGIGLEFFEYILQARLCPAPIWNRETHPHRGSRRMIGILSEDHDFDLVKWRHVKRTEYIRSLREADGSRIFATDEFGEFLPVCFVEFRGECHLPRWVDADGHSERGYEYCWENRVLYGFSSHSESHLDPIEPVDLWDRESMFHKKIILHRHDTVCVS